MRKVIYIVCFCAVAAGGFWLWDGSHQWKQYVSQYVENGDFLTLEARYSAQRLMDEHRQELLVDAEHTFQDPLLKFHPYLMFDVKYTLADKKTREGVMLWGLKDGEMVIDTETWETSHGFEDAINAGANRNDFKILLALAKSPVPVSTHELFNELHLEADVVEPWIESTVEKHLVVNEGGKLQLHFHNPKILVAPQTRLKHSFVRKGYSNSQIIPKQYSQSQIEKIAQAAFGPTFTIRNVKEVFLPVYNVNVLNPDGSIFTTTWNAITGKQM